MRRIETILRRIERSMEALDFPLMCQLTQDGKIRTISPNAKTKELENIVQKLTDCQELIETESDQEWYNGVKQTVSRRLETIFLPPVAAGG